MALCFPSFTLSARHVPVPQTKLDHIHVLLLPYTPRWLWVENDRPLYIITSQLLTSSCTGILRHYFTHHGREHTCNSLLDSWTRTHRWGLTQPYTLAPWTLEGFQWRGKISAIYPNYVKCVTVKPHIRISWEQSGTGIAENRSKTAFRDPW